jgi:hypothetical protein
MRNDFEGIALVDQKLLSFCAVEHLLRIFRHKGIEEGVETFIISPFGS